MKWRGRPGSKNIEDRRGLPDDPAWAWYDPRGWWPRWFHKKDHRPLDPQVGKSLDLYISRKDRE